MMLGPGMTCSYSTAGQPNVRFIAEDGWVMAPSDPSAQAKSHRIAMIFTGDGQFDLVFDGTLRHSVGKLPRYEDSHFSNVHLTAARWSGALWKMSRLRLWRGSMAAYHTNVLPALIGKFAEYGNVASPSSISAPEEEVPNGHMLLDLPFTTVDGRDNRGTMRPVFAQGKIMQSVMITPSGLHIHPGLPRMSNTGVQLAPWPDLAFQNEGHVHVLDIQLNDLRWISPYVDSYRKMFSFTNGEHNIIYAERGKGNLDIWCNVSRSPVINNRTVFRLNSAFRKVENYSETMGQGSDVRVSFLFYENGKVDLFHRGVRRTLVHQVPEHQSSLFPNLVFDPDASDTHATWTLSRMRLWSGPVDELERTVLPSLLGGPVEYVAVLETSEPDDVEDPGEPEETVAPEEPVAPDEPVAPEELPDDAVTVTDKTVSGDRIGMWIDTRFADAGGTDTEGFMRPFVRDGYRVPFTQLSSEGGNPGVDGNTDALGASVGSFTFERFPSLARHADDQTVTVIDLLFSDVQWVYAPSTPGVNTAPPQTLVFFELHRAISMTGTDTDRVMHLCAHEPGHVELSYSPSTSKSHLVPVFRFPIPGQNETKGGSLRVSLALRKDGAFAAYAVYAFPDGSVGGRFGREHRDPAGHLPAASSGERVDEAPLVHAVMRRNTNRMTWRLSQMRVWRGSQREYAEKIEPAISGLQSEYSVRQGPPPIPPFPSANDATNDEEDDSNVTLIIVLSTVIPIVVIIAVIVSVMIIRKRRANAAKNRSDQRDKMSG